MEKKANDKGAVISSIIILVIGVVLAASSLGWLVSNVDEIFGIFKKDPTPEPEVIVVVEPPDGMVDAVLYAECQEQLEEVLVGLGPVPTSSDREFHARYLEEASKTQVRLRDLIIRGRLMVDKLRDGEISLPDEWNELAADYRHELYGSVAELRLIGMGDSYVRAHSELFLAYHYIDHFSDQINGDSEAYTPQGDLAMAELHLNTARDLLNR